MIEPRPSVTRFVEAVFRAELAPGSRAHDGDVAQRTITRLRRELGKLIGLGGFDVLLRRSLVLARRAHPSLVAVSAAPEGVLAGLADAAHEGAASIVSHLIELLISLLGEDLAMRLMRDIWPAAEENGRN
jgi:hypothetical protein